MEIKIGMLSYNPNTILGEGSLGTLVFKGLLKRDNLLGTVLGAGKLVAIKQIQKTRVILDDEYGIKQELEILKNLPDHPNILCYLCTERNNDFDILIATQICSGTLKEYIKGTFKGPRFMTKYQMLQQVTQGLNHLHTLGIVHGDIEPTNVLIYVPSRKIGSKSIPILKLTDFGLSKILKIDQENARRWMAPEVCQSNIFDFKVDIWALGLIFGYTLSGGKHPFGNDKCTDLQEPMMVLVQDDFKQPYRGGFELIQSMMDIEPSKRPTIREVQESNFFLNHSAERTKKLLRLCSSLRKSITDDKITQITNLVKDETVDINAMNLDGLWTPLNLLCYYYDSRLMDLVKLIIEKGADINAKTQSQETPLFSLSLKENRKGNCADIIRFLIGRGADVNTECCRGLTPFFILTRNNPRMITVVDRNSNDNPGVTDMFEIALDSYGFSSSNKCG